MKNHQTKLIIFSILIATSSCFGGYGDSSVDARIYRNISKKCAGSIPLGRCRNQYYSKIVRDKNGKIIIDEEGHRIRDDNGNVIVPEDYQSKGWIGKFFTSAGQQIDAMGNY